MFDFGKSLVFIDRAFDTAEQVIRFGADELYKNGYVKESYGASVAERERDFPTGLPTEPYGIAIPHTNSSHVLKNGLCMLRLKSPVRFRQMGDEEEIVDARLVILLAVESGDGHMDLLTDLMELFSDEELLEKIASAETKEDILSLLQNANSPATV